MVLGNIRDQHIGGRGDTERRDKGTKKQSEKPHHPPTPMRVSE